jgi:hypothetical protein
LWNAGAGCTHFVVVNPFVFTSRGRLLLHVPAAIGARLPLLAQMAPSSTIQARRLDEAGRFWRKAQQNAGQQGCRKIKYKMCRMNSKNRSFPVGGLSLSLPVGQGRGLNAAGCIHGGRRQGVQKIFGLCCAEWLAIKI